MQNVLRSQSPTEEDQQQAVDTSRCTLETFVRLWGPLWIYLVKQTQPFSDLFPAYWMTLLVLPLFSFAVKREEVEFMGIRRPSASRLRQTHGRVPNETSSFITMISNLRAWRLKWFRCGLFSFPYVLPPFKDVNNKELHILLRSWSFAGFEFLQEFSISFTC